MADQTHTDNESGVRLLTPTPKAAQRLERETLFIYSKSVGADYLDVENQYRTTRSALVHLCHHVSFRSLFELRAVDLVKASREFLSAAGAGEKPDMRRFARIAALTDEIEQELLRAQAKDEISKEDVLAYIEVTDRLHDSYVQEGYSPANVADPYEYAQAHLIAANFQAYDRTLNEK